MRKLKQLIPVAGIAIGLLACSEGNPPTNTCTEPDCLSGDTPSVVDSTNTNLPDTNLDPMSSATVEQPPVPADSTPVGVESSAEAVPGPAPESSALAEVPASSAEAIPASSAEETPASSAEVTPEDTFKEDFADECNVGKVPSFSSNPKLPDPFKMFDGTPVTTKAQWKCRREELSSLLQEVELGEKPRKPESVTGSYAAGKLTVNVTDKGKSISFTVEISGNGTKDKPSPAIIGFGGGSLGSSYSGLGVATIKFNPDDLAPEASRGSGSFYKLYGSNHSAGALMAWAWGISRVIDALAVTPEAGIDVHHLGVTGCSRWGKGALVAGAFDARFALVIPQESGSGGASNWRSAAKDSEAQPLSSACTEAPWFRANFCDYKNKINDLPTDHHMLTGMVAPHGLLVLDNTGWVWLGENASYANAMSTQEIYKAWGATDAFTFSKAENHMHCSFPSSQNDEVQAFVKKYLLDKDGETTGKIEAKGVSYNVSDWQDWTTPTLQ